jgi:hypothetical protein
MKRSWDVGEPRTMWFEKKQRNSPRRPTGDRNTLRRAPLRQHHDSNESIAVVADIFSWMHG